MVTLNQVTPLGSTPVFLSISWSDEVTEERLQPLDGQGRFLKVAKKCEHKHGMIEEFNHFLTFQCVKSQFYTPIKTQTSSYSIQNH